MSFRTFGASVAIGRVLNASMRLLIGAGLPLIAASALGRAVIRTGYGRAVEVPGRCFWTESSTHRPQAPKKPPDSAKGAVPRIGHRHRIRQPNRTPTAIREHRTGRYGATFKVPRWLRRQQNIRQGAIQSPMTEALRLLSVTLGKENCLRSRGGLLP